MSVISGKHIYIMEKRKGWNMITRDKIKAFKKEFIKEESHVIKNIKRLSYNDNDYTNIRVETGKIMAKRYGATYRVIPR